MSPSYVITHASGARSVHLAALLRTAHGQRQLRAMQALYRRWLSERD